MVNIKKEVGVGKTMKTIEGGKYVEDFAFAKSEDLIVLDGEFEGWFAFDEAKNLEVRGGKFPGYAALRKTTNARISGGEFPEINILGNSKGAQIIAGNFKSKNLFSLAENVSCYLNSTIQGLSVPPSGIIVVKRIEDYNCPSYSPEYLKNIKVYAAELGESALEKQLGKERAGKSIFNPTGDYFKIHMIHPDFFNRVVNFDNLSATLAEAEKYVVPSLK